MHYGTRLRVFNVSNLYWYMHMYVNKQVELAQRVIAV